MGCQSDQDVNLPEDNPISYSFFVAGHTYGSPGVENVGVHPPFKAKFDLIRNDKTIELGVFTGDIVIMGTDQNWNEIDADIEQLGMPVHFAPGNHDTYDRALYESRYGQPYKSFIHQSDLFIILDPNIDHWNISGDQLIFLQNTLDSNAHKVDNIFVFTHQLLWWETDNKYGKVAVNSIEGKADTTNFWTEIEPMFNALPNPIFLFAGDVGAFHTGSEFMYDHYNNVSFIASGMGGGVRDNFVIVDVHEDKTVSYRLIALNGEDINALGKLEDFQLPQ
jgi:hypothetical protein